MMQQRFLMLVLPMGLFFLAGCSKDDSSQDSENGKTIVFRAVGSAASTRTVMDQWGNVTWSSDDKINVNGLPSASASLSADMKTATFTVSGVAATTNGKYCAFYPAEMVNANGFDGTNKFTINFPNTQDYNNATSFKTDVNPSVAIASSTGSATPGEVKLGFYNLCGILKFQLKKAETGTAVSGIRSVRFTSAGEVVSGDASLVTITDNPDQLSLDIKGTTGKAMSVTFPNGVTLTGDPLVIYMVLPPNTYAKGWKLQLLKSDGTVLSTAKADDDDDVLTIERSKITYAGTLRMPANGEGIVIKFEERDNSCLTAPRIYYDPVTDALQLTTNNSNHGLYFKFGGVIGIRSHKDDSDSPTYNASEDVIFDPSTLTIDGSGKTGWAKIHSQSTLGSEATIVHSLDNVKIGLGDPCKLVGIPLSVIKNATTEAQVNNNTYCTPTNEQNGTWGKSSNAAIKFDATNYGWASLLGFLPAAGYRYYGGGTANFQGYVGNYWSSTSYGSGSGRYLDFNDDDDLIPQDYYYSDYGFSVRCVAQP